MSNENGGYDLEGVIWHQHSNKLMLKILEFWPDKNIPVVDLGCGHNFYCSVLQYAGYKTKGIDQTELKGVDFIGDITDKNLLNYLPAIGKPPINVISLEVGEHLPPHLSDNYLNNLTSFFGDVIMSWAVPGQLGIGHINCQSNAWVMKEMEKRGMMICPTETLILRKAVEGCHCSWFQNTLMYFTPKPKL